MVPLSFAGHDFLALAEAALFWPARSALLVADLHFEKASWFARSGQFLPPHDSQATLDMIEMLVERTGARAVWSLGDSFHDADGAARLDPAARARLAVLTDRLDWVWITGNHDAGMARTPGGTRRTDMQVDGIWLRHEADPADPRPEISGHFHPKFRLSVRGRHVSRRCFVGSRTKLILPALGALTGGLDAGHGEIRRVMGSGAAALVPVAGRLLRFPIA
ncbi:MULTISPECIES: ligase-associated DNA damage response endonuclease PdeM [Sphingobium]|uniref:Protein phosphoesterase n=1 Tax=Sphingobium fuliginis (strain ATCC 27551) TaxID=336203 RepID=A0A292ZCE4_SPHSA|nr:MULTISPECIES: ligase-associated DNA damage response endonuclease PdeM [Sphingobium]MCB4858515.1 ligase-associated DNA damage response endonuclease PdeM [Sphingobium sp. PNB]PNP99653.1 phosphoesterase [Sphingobium sp. SA916]GAY20561.1 protein phosphoesterase [Sphingobium fuliginis]